MRHFKKHLMLAVTFVFALLLMVGCAITGSSTRVTIDVESNMTAGYEYKYVVDLGDEAGSSYELSLSKEGIVEIKESAKTIKALAEGKVVLTVTTSSGLKKSMWLEVAAPEVYAINYELNGGECSELVTSYTSVSEGVALATPTREGYNFVGWYDNAELAGEAVAEIPAGAKGDKTFYAKWDEIIIDYTVSFDSQGAGELASKTFNKYSGAVELPEVEKVGYTFAGWYNGEVKVEALDGADYEENITLVAKWEVVTYTVAYELDGGSLEGETKEYTVETETFQLVAPTKEGYKFLGWYVGEELVTEVAKGTTGNLTFTAKWEEIIIDYTVSFDTQGAGEVESKTFNKYSGAIELPQVEKAGYKFLGWYKGEELVEALDGADYEENIELVAKWELSVFEVSFDLNGASWEMDLAKFTEMILADFNTYGESTTKTTKESFKATSHPQIKNVFDDAELLAKYKWFFEFAIAEMTIAAELSGKNDYLADTVGMLERMIAGDTTAIGDANYADERTAFRWWIEGLLNETKRTGTGLYNQLMIDYGVAENLNRFVCAANGLSSTYTSEDKLPTPERFGYEFLGWYLGEEKVESVSENCTLVAKWVLGEYEVSYDLAGGAWGQNIDSFAEELVAMFNRDGASSTVTTKENFKATSHPQIKTVWAIEANLAAYKWLFEYAAAEILATAKANAVSDLTYANSTAEMLTKMAAGDTTAVGGNYADARTIFRFWLEGVMNHKLTATGTSYYQNLMVDYSVAENAAKFEAALNGVSTTLTAFDKLPTPQKENHNFLGWYLGEEKVEYVVADCTLVAKWEEAYVESEIAYELAEGQLPEGAPATYKEGLGLQNLPVPTREGYNFAGWYMGEELVTEISAAQTGKVTLTASWVAKVYAAISYELNEGELPANAPATYEVGVGLATLPTPTKGAYKFLGWYMGEELVTEISKEQTGDVTLTAKWSEEEVKEVYVGEGLDYATLDEAVQNAPEGATIILAAGEYSLSVVINKSLTIVGPYKDAEASRERENEAVIKVAVASGNLKAAKIVFNGVHLKGNGGGGGVAGLYFEDGGNVEEVAFLSCKISDMNTFFKANGTSSSLNLRIENSYIHTIGQFVVWTQNSKVQNVLLLGNIVDGYTCGGVTNSAAALFRVRSGVLEAYHNTFTGSSQNTPGYFEAIAAPSFVKYNTFENVIKFAHPTAANQLTFDQNLYLDKDGNALAAAPKEVAMNGVTVDATVCESAEALEAAFIGYLVATQPERYFALSFDLAGGEFAGAKPVGYDSQKGLTLPTPVKDGYTFAGWYLNGEKVEAIEAGTTGSLELVAKWYEAGLYVSADGVNGAYTTIGEALAAAKEGDTIIILAGEYTENVTISVADLTIKGPNAGISAVSGTRAAEAVIKGVFSVSTSASNLVIDGLAFTGAGQVKAGATSGTYNGFTFKNNNVYDTNEFTTPWVVNRYKMDAVVEFKLSGGGKSKNFVIEDNSFVNCSAVNVMVNRPHNLSVDGNLFKNFSQDAFRIEGGYTHGVHAFTNNVFEVENQGDAHVGIFFYSLSGGDAFPVVVVQNNVFKNLGQADSSKFTGALAANFYQEMGLRWDISYNIFENCYNYMWLRNNGASASNWSSTIEYNQFLGLPQEYYYGTYTGSDTATTNPHLNVFGANYYEDDNGNVITDMSLIADKFFHTATIGTALEHKPSAGEAEKYEFWTITYDLAGGSVNGLVTEYNKDTGAIALPTPTWNIYHEFKGWTLNGEVITEIPAGTKGDIVIVAVWEVVEGNPVTLNFELNGGNWRYSSFEDISADLLADYNAFCGSNYTADTLPTGAWVNINIHDFYYSEGMSEKWAWLAAWLGEVGGSANKPGCKALLDFTDAASFKAKNSNYPYEVSYEFRAIMRGSYIHSNASYKTPDYTEAALRAQIWEPLAKAQSKTLDTTEGKVLTLPEAHKQYLEFAGWYDNPEFTGEAISEITVGATNPTYYAKYIDPNPVTEIVVSGFNASMNRFQTQQLVWEVLPAAAANKEVNFESSDLNIATVDAKGFITAVDKGKCTITISSASYPNVKTVLELTVVEPAHIEAGYVTNSYVNVNDTIELYANLVNVTGNIVWSSEDETIATVVNGIVTGVKAGTTTIFAKLEGSETVVADLKVTVLEGEISEILQYILDNHNSNIFTSYDLGIGSGTPAYYSDIYGSVSKLLMNHELEINTEYLERGNATNDYYANANLQTQYGGLQFITFHYTAGMGATADTDNHASYFTGGSADVSIHYVTGNKGSDSNGATSEVYQTLDHAHGAWHAGDSNSRYYSNSTVYDEDGLKRFMWIPTGVAYDDVDLLDIVWTASDDFYFEINGKKTTIKLPDTYNYKERNTDHIYNADGTISSQDDLTFSWAKFSGRTPESFFNDQGFAVKVIDGQYYMGPTWWSYGQVVEGRICAVGGNQNSIGIESCVNEGSDLWLTWQISAQLIAKLLTDNNLTVDRVKGHHFFDGKDCPQPLLENDLEIWYEFIELVQAEYDLLNKFAGATIEFESHNPEYIDNQGRVIAVPEFTTSVSYTIKVTYNGKTESITLSSVLPGMYEKA